MLSNRQPCKEKYLAKNIVSIDIKTNNVKVLIRVPNVISLHSGFSDEFLARFFMAIIFTFDKRFNIVEYRLVTAKLRTTVV
jgi:hypothetical protein